MNTHYEKAFTDILDDLDIIMFSDVSLIDEAYVRARGRLLDLAKRAHAIRDASDEEPLPLPEIKPIPKKKSGRVHRSKKPTPTFDRVSGTVSSYTEFGNAAMRTQPCPTCSASKGRPCTHIKTTQFGKKGEYTRTLHRARADMMTRFKEGNHA